MSTLVIQIPPRQRLRARALGGADAESQVGREYNYVLSPDGVVVASQGRCAASLMPRAATVVAVLCDEDVSWHRLALPKAPAARLQSALVGMLEEALLEDADAVHLALEPEAHTGSPTWVAATERAWLVGELAALENAQMFVDRVVPMSWPDEPPRGHFSDHGEEFPAGDNPVAGTWLSWAHPEGVALLTLQGTLAHSLLPSPQPDDAHWSATPSAAAAAEAWLGFPVAVMSWPQRALQATRSLWNLRQFDLARKNRGSRAARDLWRQFLRPEWRPVRIGLVSLVVVQLLGLNLWASHQRSEMTARRAAMESLLRATHPQVRAVLDAPVQMQRETDFLRAAAGKPSETDFEPMLQLAAMAWPADRPAVDTLRYEPGKLTLAAAGWSAEQIARFRGQLQPRGWQVDATDGRLVLTRQPPSIAGRKP